MADSDLEVTEQARRIRRAILDRHGYTAESNVPLAGQAGALQEAAARATINAHWGLGSQLPLVGWAVVLVQRALRIALRWYINPIVDQQTAFNEAVVRALYELQAENETLRSSLTGERQKDARQ